MSAKATTSLRPAKCHQPFATIPPKVVVDRAQFRSREAQKVVTLKQVRAKTGIAVRSAERALFRLALADKVIIEDARYRVK